MIKNRKEVIVAGLGEIGKPLFELVSKKFDTAGVDISPIDQVDSADVLHICYPYQIPDFLGEGARYISLYQPSLTIINSTVPIGTTRALAKRTGAAVVNSPVRGKHANMLDQMRHYAKFVGAMDAATGARAAQHFEAFGLKTKVLSSPEATELAKLTETTYFGLMIAWAQEVERYCDQAEQDYEEVVSFYDEIKFFPPKYFPGTIGGHCVMPNIGLLNEFSASNILDAIRTSNAMKIKRETYSKDSVAV